MNKTKIEWCDSTFNPVTGCLHNCEYCYARKIATRFGGNYGEIGLNGEEIYIHKLNHIEIKDGKACTYPFKFEPTFHKYRLEEPAQKTKPRNIFVCSMADLFGDWVPDEWIQEVFKACEAVPQHRYLFLTKNPGKYKELYSRKGFPYHNNFWFGTSITGPNQDFAWFNDTPYHSFISIEPLLAPLGHIESEHMPEWVIIGAETGNRKNKVVPKGEWIKSIVNKCRKFRIPVFMKNSLIPIVGEENMIREFPWR